MPLAQGLDEPQAQCNQVSKMSDWLDVNDVVEFLQEVGVQMVMLSGQRVKVNHNILLHCDVVHYMDEVQQRLQHTGRGNKHTGLL